MLFGFVLGTSGPYPILVLIYDFISTNNQTQAILITFKISNSFSDWSKIFDKSIISSSIKSESLPFDG